MTISGVTSNDYYLSNLSTSTSTSRAGQRSNPLAKALDSLQSALNSGDTATAQSVLSDILSHAPKSSSSGDGSSGGDKIGSLLKQVSSALSSGDTATAQSLVSSLEDYLAANPPPQPPGGSANTSNTASESSNPLAKALDSLQSALNSGDTTTAQSVLSDLLAHAPESSSSNDDSSSSDSSSGASAGDTIGNFLEQLKSAVSSGQTSSAQSLLSSLKDYLAANPPPQPPGVGTYATDGTLTASSASSNSSLGWLA